MGHEVKRAIVWLCWGERFINDAMESARTTLAIDADRVLITDPAGALHAHNATEFNSIISMNLVYENNLEKSRLIDFIPKDYSTFLFLDTDTRIIGDVTLGFDKAEQHGIAMVPAPNYNLNEFFNFARIMAHLGVKSADQMMYNSGVIFFHLTLTVRQVLEGWRDFAAVGASQKFPRDQPFLTLAIEQFGLTPYVLSPLYNYRNLGEYAVGHIRIWHSHYPPPSNVNEFKNAWPARRFKDGVRLPSETDMADARLPQGMVELALRQAKLLRSPLAVQTFAENILTVQHEQGSRAANGLLLKYIGIEASLDRDESYFTEALHYHLGLMHAHARDPVKMAEHIRLSNTMPSGEDDQLFSDQVNVSHVVRTSQLDGIARGLPPIVVFCMPRSASATLTHTFARVVGFPVVHISAGQFPDYSLVPSWLDMFLEGGAITQDHVGTTDFNVGVLSDRGSRDIFVLIRDPRAAARSQLHYLARGRSNEVDGPLELRIERECIANFIPWLQGWIDCARRTDLLFRIHFVTFQQICRDLAGVICKISTILQENYPAMSAYAALQTVEEVRVHLVTGNDHAWQAEISDATRDRLWAACTSDMKSLLNLEW